VTPAVKGALAAGVLVLAVLVAVLPRVGSHSGGAAPAAPDLGAARAKAALPSCPADGGPQVARLRGVVDDCLGTGRPVDLGTALGGRATLINVWATWCGPCKTELPVLDSYAAQPGAARVVAVQVASSPADGLDLLTRLGVHLPVVHDGSGDTGPLRSALAVPPALPASYLVTPDGQVRFIGDPRVFGTVDQVRAAVGTAA
jgi:thiol-disulfide isomerase/thioredoxin